MCPQIRRHAARRLLRKVRDGLAVGKPWLVERSVGMMPEAQAKETD
jgi:hypothetical protein